MTRPESSDGPMPPVGGSIRPPESELTDAEYGSTAQFKAFASGDAVAGASDLGTQPGGRDADPDRSSTLGSSGRTAPVEPAPEPAAASPIGQGESVEPPALPMGKRNTRKALYMALAVVVLVAVAITLLLVLL